MVILAKTRLDRQKGLVEIPYRVKHSIWCIFAFGSHFNDNTMNQSQLKDLILPDRTRNWRHFNRYYEDPVTSRNQGEEEISIRHTSSRK